MSLDNQRNLKLAIHGDAVFMKVAEQVAAEMNRWASEFFGKPIVADWRQQLSFTTKIFRARGLHLDDRQIRHANGEGFSAAIVDATLYLVNNHRRLLDSGASLVLVPAEDPDRRRGGAVERHPVGARTASAACGWDGQDLRARRAVRSVFSVDGDTGGARAALRRLQHRALGLHQQRLRRAGMGSVVRESEHRSDHDDLRLHAHLRRSRAPRREHARRQRAVRALAGRDGAQHSRRVGGGRCGRHEARDRRRGTGAARRRQRQVGRALEDGPHRAAGVGKGRRGQSAWPIVSDD